MYDVIVVGGGPAGSKSARLLSRDHDVMVLEDHNCSGEPVECTGLISPDVIRESGIKPDILNSFSNLCAVFPDGRKVTVRCKDEKAVVIDRADFDRKMADKAIDAGAKYVYSKRCTSCSVQNDSVSVFSDNDRYDGKVLIGADGHTSTVRQQLFTQRPEMYVRGIQADVEFTYEYQDTIDIFLGSDVAPDFFAWAIPFDDRVRVGLCCGWDNELPAFYFKKLLQKLKMDDSKVIMKNSGKIPLGTLSKTYRDRVLLVGDSAGQVKPISGGGLYPGLVSAGHAADVIHEAFQLEDFSEKMLKQYHKRWKSSVGKELKSGLRLRKMYNNLSDSDLNSVGAIVDDRKILDPISKVTLDSVSDAVPIVMKNLPVAFKLLPYMIKGVIR